MIEKGMHGCVGRKHTYVKRNFAPRLCQSRINKTKKNDGFFLMKLQHWNVDELKRVFSGHQNGLISPINHPDVCESNKVQIENVVNVERCIQISIMYHQSKQQYGWTISRRNRQTSGAKFNRFSWSYSVHCRIRSVIAVGVSSRHCSTFNFNLPLPTSHIIYHARIWSLIIVRWGSNVPVLYY